MNAHTMGSILTHEEIKHIALVPTQIISPSKCKPIITLVQDTIVGAYLMTQDGSVMDKKRMENMMMNVRTFDGIIPEADGKNDNGNEYWTGKTVYSMILPDLSLNLKNDSGQQVLIKNGEYLSGTLDKSIIGGRGLIQDILNTYGTDRCHAFLDETQNIVTRWLEDHGFSVGVGDAVPINKEMKNKIEEIIDNKIEESKEQITLAYQGLYEKNLDDELRLKHMDKMLQKIGGDCEAEVVKYIKNNLPKDNRFYVMINSGAKGKVMPNMQQITGVVGQTSIWGARIPDGFNNRTLPHFHKYDFGLTAKGFIRNSFIKGLTPSEFFFAMMGGRTGMIDTAVRSVTGDTPIVITENGKAKRVLIGDWIDGYMDNRKNVDKIEKYDERNLELFRTDDQKMYIPTIDEKGNVSWGKITALTRHDPGEELYKIKTLGGREVIVSAAKSLLIWNSEKHEFEPKDSPDVKVNDYVPVTCNLQKHHDELKYINLEDYLPKNKYIYGTDFHIAYDLVFNKYSGKVPVGWWKENNGKLFTLPYEHCHRLLRVVSRSDISNIKKGYVYPYHGKRIETYIPEKFELNRENGVFFGLFLADGDCDFKSGMVRISKNDISIQKFVQNWFDKHSIKWQMYTKTSKMGNSTSIRGFSRILAELFDTWFGKGAANKHIPNEAYLGNDEFIIGLLDGYFSGDGTVGKNCIEVSSASQELIEGIGSLCSRLGIFCKYFVTQTKWDKFGTENILPMHRISIRAQWVKKFSELISLTHNEKQTKLENISYANIHCNFPLQNDVVLDKIVSIEIIGVEKYPRLYDLTIPETLNFAIGNGLCVRDTAETGYISRRLMKGAEDVKVLYDGTVRNASNNIVQFTYGDDNYDPVKLEKVDIPLMKYNNLEMNKYYNFEDMITSEKDWQNILLKGAVKQLLEVKEYKDLLKKEYDLMMQLRENLRHKYFKGTDIIDVTTYMPFNLQRFIPAMKFKFNIGENSVSDISPIYVINKVDELCKFVTKYMKDDNSNKLTKIIIRTFLASKMVIVQYKLNKLAFDHIIKELENKILTAFVQPGEMVGPVAAQSLGEANTQLTLNSVEYNEMILVKKNGIPVATKIGEFIDNIMDNTTDRSLLEYHPNDTKLRWTKENDYAVISVDEDGKITWKKVEAVTKHPVINEDGSDTLIKVTTRSGRAVTATKAKSFLTRKDNKIVATNGSELKVGDRLPVMKNFPMNDVEELDEISLEEYFPKTEYIWGSEMKKAYDCSLKEKYWFKKNNGIKFVTPFKRSDTLLDILKTEFRTRPNYQAQRRRQIEFNKIYEKNGYSNGFVEKIKLDKLFGFFIGAYLAEGCVTTNYVAIANNDEKYRQMIIDFCEKYDQTYHIQTQHDKNGPGWLSTDIRIHSKLLATLINNLCGKGSEFKVVPSFAYIANDEFIKGLLNGYFSGDGCVYKNTIGCSSISENLIDGIMNLLGRFDIYARKYKRCGKQNRFIGTCFVKNNKDIYELSIRNGNAIKFSSHIDLVIDKKQDRLDDIYFDYEVINENDIFDIIPGNNTQSIKNKIHRSELKKILNTIDKKSEEYKILENALYSDVYFDEIIKIEETRSEKKYVYDLTIEKTRTFCGFNGICLFDTFHSAGAAAGSVAVTAGVPRMKEIINLSRNMKTPSEVIYLKEEYAFNKDKAEEIKNQVEYTKLADVISKTEIIYEDVDELDINVDNKSGEDLEFMKLYYEFNDLICVDSHEELSKWVLRMEFDRELMMAKNILMSDIQEAILQNSQREDDIQCIISDDNSANLIMRIRVRSEADDENFLSFFKELEKHILEMALRGVKGITNANLVESNIVKYDPDGSYKTVKEWTIQTEGSNLADTMLLDNIDMTRTLTNDVVETYEIFGIEGVRSKIFKELEKVFMESNINQRHIALLADIMTYRGNIMQIDRHGINRSPDNGVIAKASFEEVTDMFLKASVFSEYDKMTGVSANIMYGQLAPVGTKSFDLLFDENKLMEYGIDEEEQEEFEPDELDDDIVQEEINDMFEDDEEEEMVNDDDFEFGYHQDNIVEFNIGPAKDEIKESVKIVDTKNTKPNTRKLKIKNI